MITLVPERDIAGSVVIPEVNNMVTVNILEDPSDGNLSCKDEKLSSIINDVL